MLQRISQIILTAAGVLSLLLFSCCKQPIQPIQPIITKETKLNFDEPDTIKSSVSFTLISPYRNIFRWEGKLPSDTLSNRVFNSLGVLMRTSAIQEDGINFYHTLPTNTCRFSCSKALNLFTQDYIRLNDGVLDALRSWQSGNLQFSWKMPKTITNQVKIDTVASFLWSDMHHQEGIFRGNTPNSWSIQNYVSNVYADIEYWPLFWQKYDTTQSNTITLNRYRTRLESAEIFIDRYDTIKQRVDGRFNFRVIGYNNSIVHIQNGRFLNVKLY